MAGSLAGAYFGLYDIAEVAHAAWIGFPTTGWPGLNLDLGPVFWSLLPVFILVAVIDGMATVGDSVAIQSVSWRRRRPVDFRSIQGAVAGTGVSTQLSGLAGAVPNKIHILTAGIVEMTGVGARIVGMYTASVFVLTAFLPKIPALLLAIPSPVIAAYTLVFIGLLFSSGLRIVLQGGFNYRKALVVGLSFWMGVGFEDDWFFSEFLRENVGWLEGGLLGNGLAAGAICAVVLTGVEDVATSRRWKMEAELDVAALSRIIALLEDIAAGRNWPRGLHHRLCLVAEEALLTLIREGAEDEGEDGSRRFRLSLRLGREDIEIEFVAAATNANIEDHLAVMDDQRVSESQDEYSLMLLRSLASSVRHQQFYDMDVITVTVNPEE